LPNIAGKRPPIVEITSGELGSYRKNHLLRHFSGSSIGTLRAHNADVMEKQYRIEIKVLDHFGRKVKELIEELPGSTSLDAVIESGRRLHAVTKRTSLKYEIHERS
jgi:hypothetical protein